MIELELLELDELLVVLVVVLVLEVLVLLLVVELLEVIEPLPVEDFDPLEPDPPAPEPAPPFPEEVREEVREEVCELVVVVLRDGWVVVELEEDEPEPDELAAEETGGALVVVAVVVVAAAGAQDSLSERTGNEIGKLMLDSGVPGGTLTVKDCVTPPATVTVTVHSSADAAGTDPTASTVLTDATATISLVPLSTRLSSPAAFLHDTVRSQPTERRHALQRRTVASGSWFCSKPARHDAESSAPCAFPASAPCKRNCSGRPGGRPWNPRFGHM